jgi:GT2 family glycosyltransferase
MKRIAGITAIISTLNRPSALSRCLDALLAGEVSPAEIIVMDQSDNDETRTVVSLRSAPDVQIKYMHQERRGVSFSRNTAIADANFPFVAITDDDCVPDSRWIATIERIFSLTNAPDAITGRVLPLGPDTPGLYAVSSRRTVIRTEFSGRVEPWLVGTGGNFAIKREWLDRIGLFDEHLGPGSPGGAAEDLDVFYRLTRAGARVLYEPDSLIYHERQNKARRLASRSTYGRGMGTFCAIWLRRRDLYSIHILSRWLAIRGRMLASSLRHRQWTSAYEEVLMLRGTFLGFFQTLFQSQAATYRVEPILGGTRPERS